MSGGGRRAWWTRAGRRSGPHGSGSLPCGLGSQQLLPAHGVSALGGAGYTPRTSAIFRPAFR